ncbi:PDPFL protein, partial [Nycticryphes semicollaris]|nr:PDPFL protein [Nycticryphes semicollaris]
MASVPSVGCLLAKNQYYRSKCPGEGPGASLRSGVWAFSTRENCLMMWASSPLAGLPELIDKCWWIKSFFHSEPSPPTVGRKTLSAS